MVRSGSCFWKIFQDPGNVGPLFGLRMQQVLLGLLFPDKSADIYSLKTLRSIQGQSFSSAYLPDVGSALLKETKGNYPSAGNNLI